MQEARGGHNFGSWLYAAQHSRPIGYLLCQRLPSQLSCRCWSLQYFVSCSSHRPCGRGERSLLVLPLGNATVREAADVGITALSLLLVVIQHTFEGRPQPGDYFPLHVCYPVLHKRVLHMLQEKESLSRQLYGATLAFAGSTAWSRTF